MTRLEWDLAVVGDAPYWWRLENVMQAYGTDAETRLFHIGFSGSEEVAGSLTVNLDQQIAMVRRPLSLSGEPTIIDLDMKNEGHYDTLLFEKLLLISRIY